MTAEEELVGRRDLISAITPELTQFASAHEARWIAHFVDKKKISADKKRILAFEIVARRRLGEPLAYIFGQWAFRDHEILVGPGVLIPRPETEELIEAILKTLENSEISSKQILETGLSVVDLGAGSGCIGLSLVADLLRDVAIEGHDPQSVSKKFRLTLVENSPEALPWLKKNVEAFATKIFSTQVEFFLGDWKSWSGTAVDVMISNPPYVTGAEFTTLDTSVSQYEPRTSLVPETLGTWSDATGPYREIFEVARKHLGAQGWLWFELGAAQVNWIQNYAATLGYLNDLRTLHDMTGKVRFFCARRSI